LFDEEEVSCSYLDQEAKIPFRKLKQVCYNIYNIYVQ
jgi:hypothetical protein